MRKVFTCILLSLCIHLFFINQSIEAANDTIKVLDIETSTVIKEIPRSAAIDRYVKEAIRSITQVTVQAKPVPKKGYLIKIPLTKSLKVKNKWFDDIVSEVLLLYNPSTKRQGKIILYNDENTPLFFDIDYDFAPLFKKINLQE